MSYEIGNFLQQKACAVGIIATGCTPIQFFAAKSRYLVSNLSVTWHGLPVLSDTTGASDPVPLFVVAEVAYVLARS